MFEWIEKFLQADLESSLVNRELKELKTPVMGQKSSRPSTATGNHPTSRPTTSSGHLQYQPGLGSGSISVTSAAPTATDYSNRPIAPPRRSSTSSHNNPPGSTRLLNEPKKGLTRTGAAGPTPTSRHARQSTTSYSSLYHDHQEAAAQQFTLTRPLSASTASVLENRRQDDRPKVPYVQPRSSLTKVEAELHDLLAKKPIRHHEDQPEEQCTLSHLGLTRHSPQTSPMRPVVIQPKSEPSLTREEVDILGLKGQPTHQFTNAASTTTRLDPQPSGPKVNTFQPVQEALPKTNPSRRPRHVYSRADLLKFAPEPPESASPLMTETSTGMFGIGEIHSTQSDVAREIRSPPQLHTQSSPTGPQNMQNLAATNRESAVITTRTKGESSGDERVSPRPTSAHAAFENALQESLLVGQSQTPQAGEQRNKADFNKTTTVKRTGGENWLAGTIKAVKLPGNFGFITPDGALPEPFVNKDVHFKFGDYESGTPPQAGESVMFILRKGAHKRPTAYKVSSPEHTPGQETRIDQPQRNRDPSRERGAKSGSKASADIPGLKKPGLLATPCTQGKIVSIRTNAGFIKPDFPLTADYNQNRQIYFDVSRAQAGHLQLVPGDRVSFSLGTKDKGRPMAFSVKLAQCKPRRAQALAEHIDEVALKVREIIAEGGRNRTHSEYIVDLMSSQVAWDCIGRCTSLSPTSVEQLLQLLLDLEGQSRSMSTLFCRALKALSHTPFLNPWKGCLQDYVSTSFKKQEQAAISTLHAFLLMLMQHVPEKTRAVVSLVKPIVNTDKSSAEYLLYSMLKRASKLSTGSVEDMEWDELPLVPTLSELLSDTLESERNLRQVNEKGPYDSAQDYLDTYIRLLRADCFEALKKGLGDFLSGKLDPRDMNMYHKLHLVGIQLTRQESGLAIGLKVTPQREVRNWSTCSNLMFGNLLCISPNATFRDAIWATVVNRNALPSHQVVVVELCTERNSISDSEAVLQLESMNGQTIMAESPTYYRAYQPVLSSLQKVDPECLPFHEEVVQVQRDVKVPQFLQDDPEGTVDAGLIYRGLGDTNVLDLALSDSRQAKTSLDTSQEKAIKQALLHRLAIIQGPPGTGKTFVGVKLVQLLLSMSCVPEAPILLLTYKNHALDESLKGLIHAGINNVVRIGGRSQDPELEKYNLNEIRKTKKISGELFKHIKALQPELSELKDEVEIAFEKLDNARSFGRGLLSRTLNSEQLAGLLIGCDWDKSQVTSFKQGAKGLEVQVCKERVQELLDSLGMPLGDFLQQSPDVQKKATIHLLIQEATRQWAPSITAIQKVESRMKSHVKRVNAEALFAPSTLKKSSSSEELFTEKDIEEQLTERMAASGYSLQMKRSEELMKDFKLMNKSKNGGHNLFGVTREAATHEPIQILMNVEDLWFLREDDRVNLIQALLLQQFEAAAVEFETRLEEYQKLCAVKNELEVQHRGAILSDVQVVGITITGASIQHQLLEQIRPAVVIVEEAAEVLEPQITAVLGNWVQQLILIGDHKQLRPSVNSYMLRRDYNFDISLMERLINNGFPYSTLSMQNRMRTEFAELLLDIYPKLQSNLTRVTKNAPANCVQYSMYFWDHQHEETSSKGQRKDPALSGSRSHTNEEEAERAIRLALFLIQQGYKPSQVTILAAYQGQVALIRRLMLAAKTAHTELFEEPHGSPGKTPDKTSDESKLQIQTIDMYQGDENDFVIVSLVRSNTECDTGFVKSLNRRCVAQSRAKCGMYFIGNYHTIASAPTWREMLGKMHGAGLVGSVMPLCCPKHPAVSKLAAREATDITLGSFCKIKCDAEMACGEHKCLKTCQPTHSHTKCTQIVEFSFKKCGHPSSRKCCTPEEKCRCQKKMESMLPCNHIGSRKCCEDPSSVRCMELCLKPLPCKHPCQRKCCQPCDPDGCDICERIRKEKAELLRKQQEAYLRQVKEDAQREIKELEKKMEEQVSFLELLPSGDTASEYYDVADKVKKYIQPGHKWYPNITKIEKVSNPKQQMKWMRMKLKVHDPSHVERKFHGTTTDGAAGIIKEGFRMPDPKGQMFGAGIYFATDSSKSAQEIYTKGSNLLLLCDVLLGKTMTVQQAQPQMTLQKLKSKGYDSLFAERDSRATGGVQNDEFVVYNPDQALPRFIIHYQKGDVTDGHVASQLDQLEKMSLGTKKMVHHHLTPQRGLRPNDPLEMHFRIAESQVLRLLKGSNIESVDYYINPPLVEKFHKKAKQFSMKYGGFSAEADHILAFHGTSPDNIQGIVKDNFRMDMRARGLYGAGIYFSEFPDVSQGYGKALLLCRVLPGRTYDCPGQMNNAGLEHGYDSHRYRADKEGRGQMLIIFNPEQILPCYVINLK